MVEFVYKDGRKREMEERYAKPLQQMGYGTYLTRDMAAARPLAKPPEVETPEVETPEVIPQPDFRSMTATQLRALAQAHGIKVDATWGKSRLIRTIQGRG